MRPFAYSRATDLDHAARLAGDGARPIAGGTNLLDLMKLEVETPDALVDINRLPLGGIETHGDGLRIGALVSNSACAADERIRRDYPVLARAILAGATFQLRNMATTAGNLCQRTRCYYFYNTDMPCNKRAPGSGCSAIGGFNRIHAILGASDACIATYPGDMAVALCALDATVEIAGRDGQARSVPVRAFHRLPGDAPERDNILEPGEVITAVMLPAPPGGKHIYRKVRDRSSYAFALVSIAAVVRMDRGAIASASLAFGALAHKPWHDTRIDDLLTGQAPSDALFDAAADRLLEGATGQGANDFKIPMARRILKAVLREATGDAT
ncbi:molybdopterin dehydrogenase [Polymorphobacter multimanifer]|uniref:Xanthine dehydrogenase YagS FAD-binding subunit n=1 Tax=Polymorphobacter multimanifer TaxID=1070431 RepID=A0A841L792_9SPHN|nr:xanthine dehydrogenase family protein subunit M [Polymorphobacter multimanifer]MBB6228454.1 xanthine dehydrogenase YagS FAD-binding subunit [Polymorphobacter multimanifer]GGI74574.1 molybdopterin dehydrogenase [Polymorphobacter multimanifer]